MLSIHGWCNYQYTMNWKIRIVALLRRMVMDLNIAKFDVYLYENFNIQYFYLVFFWNYFSQQFSKIQDQWHFSKWKDVSEDLCVARGIKSDYSLSNKQKENISSHPLVQIFLNSNVHIFQILLISNVNIVQILIIFN